MIHSTYKAPAASLKQSSLINFDAADCRQMAFSFSAQASEQETSQKNKETYFGKFVILLGNFPFYKILQNRTKHLFTLFTNARGPLSIQQDVSLHYTFY